MGTLNNIVSVSNLFVCSVHVKMSASPMRQTRVNQIADVTLENFCKILYGLAGCDFISRLHNFLINRDDAIIMGSHYNWSAVLLNTDALLVDAYTLARMFRNYHQSHILPSCIILVL
jgi:hypothetical protein